MTRYEDHILLRLIHSDMLEEVLTNRMYSKNSDHEIPGYINIGDAELIKQRDEYVVKIDPPNGHLGDYIPFSLQVIRRCCSTSRQDIEV